MTRRIGIVEDHRLLAETVALALSVEGFEVVVGDLTDRATVVASLVPRPDLLVLLDLELGAAVGDGTALVAPLRAAGAQVLVVTGVRDRVRLAAAVEAGAVGHVAKDQPFEQLLDTIVRAARGEPVLDAAERAALAGDLRRFRAERAAVLAPFHALSPREREVLARLASGESVECIARTSFVSTATVRSQVRGVLTKLDVNSQLAAVAKARAAGWAP